MNNANKDAYTRILNIYSLFQINTASADSISVDEIVDLLGVNKYTICNDLENMTNTREIQFSFGPLKTIPDDKLSEYKKEIFKRLHTDDELIGYLEQSCDVTVGLTALEKIILLKYQQTKEMNSLLPRDTDIYFKRQRVVSKKIVNLVRELRNAVYYNCTIDLIERTKNSNTVYKNLLPVKDITYNYKGDYYFVFIDYDKAEDKLSHRIIKLTENMTIKTNNHGLKIKNPTEDKKIIGKEKKKIDDELEYRWGVSDDCEKFDVKLKVYKDGTADVIKRMKESLQERKYGQWEDSTDGLYSIYTDKAIGKEAFCEWAMSFGSSVVVLQPKDVGQKLYDLAKERLEVYSNLDTTASLENP